MDGGMIDGWRDDGWRDRWRDGGIDGEMEGWMEEWIEGWMKGGRDGGRDGWENQGREGGTDRQTLRCLLISYFPFVIQEVFVFLSSPKFCINTFLQGKFSMSSCKGNHILVTHLPQIPSVPSVATLSSSIRMKMSVNKGVPKQTHPGSQVFCTRGAQCPAFPRCPITTGQ